MARITAITALEADAELCRLREMVVRSGLTVLLLLAVDPTLPLSLVACASNGAGDRLIALAPGDQLDLLTS